MNGEILNQDVQCVSCSISDWLDEMRRLLQSVQLLLENVSPAQGAPAEVAALLESLPPMVRQCRSQVPTQRMVEVWVREVANANHRMRLNAGGLDARPKTRREPMTA